MGLRSALLLSTICWSISIGDALIGYDCGADKLNITTLSLLDVGECNMPKTEPKIKKMYVQLLQLSDFSKIQVLQCKLLIDRTVYHCGMNSHISIVAQGAREYLADLGVEQCKRIHQTGVYTVTPAIVIVGLKSNATTRHSITLAGQIGNNGACKGTQYADPHGSWDDVVVQASMSVTLFDYYATAKPDTNRIVLRSGMSCPLSESSCIDLEGGHTFWNLSPPDHCNFDRYDVLYEGDASKISNEQEERPQVVYTVTTPTATFALTERGHQVICGYTLIRTEHPKLFILNGAKETILTRKPMATENYDLFTYVNAKFIYVEGHIRNELNRLYFDVLLQNCKLEREVLKNALNLATQAPDEFAYQLMKGPGHMALVAGEVVHIIKCIPVDVTVRRTEECYHQLPVSHHNQSVFLSPRTRIIFEAGTQITCNPMVPAMYQIEETWYKFLPSPAEALIPAQIKPFSKPTWKYMSPSHLATSGIYSQEDLNKLRDHIMFPAERPAILNTIARSLAGQPTLRQGMSLANLLDEESLERITKNTWNRIWTSFLTFGSASAGVLGILLIFRGIKLIADTIIHGYALHTVYGWSLHLIGALWSSVTHLLLHLGKNDAANPPTGQDELPTFNREPEPKPEEPTAPLYPRHQLGSFMGVRAKEDGSTVAFTFGKP